jgi:hypothetical protein
MSHKWINCSIKKRQFPLLEIGFWDQNYPKKRIDSLVLLANSTGGMIASQ